jgi:hypothetical protein
LNTEDLERKKNELTNNGLDVIVSSNQTFHVAAIILEIVGVESNFVGL